MFWCSGDVSGEYRGADGSGKLYLIYCLFLKMICIINFLPKLNEVTLRSFKNWEHCMQLVVALLKRHELLTFLKRDLVLIIIARSNMKRRI